MDEIILIIFIPLKVNIEMLNMIIGILLQVNFSVFINTLFNSLMELIDKKNKSKINC